MNSRKRTRLEVIYDMLRAASNKKEGIKPTHLMYKSNLSYSMMESYLESLKEKEFVEERNLKKGKVYTVTQKGRVFLERYSEVESFINSFGLQ